MEIHQAYAERGPETVPYLPGSNGALPRPTTAKLNGATDPVISSNNQVLNSLPHDHFAALRASLRRVKLKKEQFLFQQDDEIGQIYFPETAVVSEFKMLDDGRMVEVAMTGSEGAVGLCVMCRASRTVNCVQVSQPGLAVKLDLADFERTVRIHGDLRQYFLPYLDGYIRFIAQKAICNMYHSVEERFCTWLLMLHDRCRKPTLKLTHEQIARTLGVYRPSVNCIALEMRKKGMIDYSRGGITILDRGEIEAAACGCYEELALATSPAAASMIQ